MKVCSGQDLKELGYLNLSGAGQIRMLVPSLESVAFSSSCRRLP